MKRWDEGAHMVTNPTFIDAAFSGECATLGPVGHVTHAIYPRQVFLMYTPTLCTLSHPLTLSHTIHPPHIAHSTDQLSIFLVSSW